MDQSIRRPPVRSPQRSVPISRDLIDRLVAAMTARLPGKSFGYLLAEPGRSTPIDFVLFEKNVRNDAQWRPEFEAYGEYYVVNDDAGFVADPDEALRLQLEIWRRDLVEVALFHSHHRHPADFSQIDFDMHTERFGDLWHLLVSFRSPDQPVVRGFSVDRVDGVEELVLVDAATDSSWPDGLRPAWPGSALGRSGSDDQPGEPTLEWAIERLSGRRGAPPMLDAAEVLTAVTVIERSGDRTLIDELVDGGVLAGADDRFQELVAADMVQVDGARFVMGRDPDRPGPRAEGPAHPVELSPFAVSRFCVTNGLYRHVDPDRNPARAERDLPAVGLSWAEAALFARWVGCRLPTEAEWEYASGSGTADRWCCGSEADLERHAWYCRNSRGARCPVGRLEPNQLGLFDVHGNVWEWCLDAWDPGYYRRAPALDPICLDGPSADRVTRGGGFNGHADMCRTRYRCHEPLGFRAHDLGLRLVRPGPTT